MDELSRVVGRYSWLAFAISVFTIVCLWRIFEKAREPGWKCLIPIYNIYIETKIADYTQYFWFALFGTLGFSILAGIFATASRSPDAAVILTVVFAIVMLVMSIKFLVRLSHAFGKTGAFAVGLIFLPVIFLAILAFGSAEYQLGGTSTALRSDEVRAWQCPNFGTYNPVSTSACRECGTARSDKERIG